MNHTQLRAPEHVWALTLQKGWKEMGGSISPLPFGLLTEHICHVPSLHLQTLKNISSSQQWNLLIFRFSSELHQAAFEMKNEPWFKKHEAISHDKVSPAPSALCLLSLEGQAPHFQRLQPWIFPVEELWPHSVCKQWLTLLLWLSAMHWMSLISPSELRSEGRSHSWHFSAIFVLQLCSNIVRNDSVTDDPAMEQGERGPLKVPLRIWGVWWLCGRQHFS